MAAQVADKHYKCCVFCGLQLKSSRSNILYHADCNRTLKAHYAREVRRITESLSKTLELIDRVCHG